MAGKGGGAWKVAYADFVTAMMAFFMVMWLVGQNAETKEAVQHYFQHPTIRLLPAWISQGPHEGSGTPHKHDGEDPGPEDGTGSKVNRPQRRIRAEDVRHARLLMRTDGDQTVVGSVIHFAVDSAVLTSTAQDELDRLVPQLMGKNNRIELRGHTARRSTFDEGGFADDWQLSFARALAVMQYLENAGVEPQRMRLSQAAAHEPPSDSQDKSAPQSRVEVYVLSEFIETNLPDEHAIAAPHFDDHEPGDINGANDHDTHGEQNSPMSDEQNRHTVPEDKAAGGHKPKAKASHSGHGHSQGVKKPAAKPSHGSHATKKPAAKSSHGTKKPAKSSHGGH